MKIKEVSKKFSLPISTLHYYERVQLVTPERGENDSIFGGKIREYQDLYRKVIG